MNGLYTIILLVMSNVFMTLAWYGRPKAAKPARSGGLAAQGLSLSRGA